MAVSSLTQQIENEYDLVEDIGESFDLKAQGKNQKEEQGTENQIQNLLINTRFKIEARTRDKVKISPSIHASLFGVPFDD